MKKEVNDSTIYLEIFIVTKENIGEESFYIIKHAIVSIFKDRMALLSEEIKKLKKCEDALERLYNSGRFLFTLDYLISNKIIT